MFDRNSDFAWLAISAEAWVCFSACVATDMAVLLSWLEANCLGPQLLNLGNCTGG